MKPLIDADLIVYEASACGQYINEDGEVVAKDFSYVAEIVDQKVREICALVWATEEPLMFLTMNAKTKKRHIRKANREIARLEKRLEGTPLDTSTLVEIRQIQDSNVYKPNFREAVASKVGYKENRKASARPLHYDNCVEYILASYDCVVAEGLEADDMLSIYQRAAPHLTTIICSRDKDLKIVPGLHFGWAVGKQAQFGPERVSELGRLRPIYRGKTAKGEPMLAGLKGTGMSFFFAQLITGDTIDNIPGIPGAGPKAAFLALKDITSVEEGYRAVKGLYVKKFGNDWEAEMLEQGQLLWMVAELDGDGKPVMWEIPEYLTEG